MENLTTTAPAGDTAAPQPAAPASAEPTAPETTSSQDTPSIAAAPKEEKQPDKSFSDILAETDDIAVLERFAEEASKSAPAPKEEKKPAAAPAADPTPEPSATPDPEEKGLLANRPRLSFLEEDEKVTINRALQMVRQAKEKGETLSIVDAMLKASGASGAPKEAATPAEPATPATPAVPENPFAEFDQQLSANEQEITSTLTAIKEAKSSYDTEKEIDLYDKLTDLKVKRERILDEKAYAQQEAEYAQSQEFETAYLSARTQALAILPDSGTDGHPDFDAVRDLVAKLRKSTPQFFDDPQYPVLIAQMVLGSRRSAAPAAPSEPTPPPVPRREARPAIPAPVGGDATAQHELTRDDLYRKIEEMTPAELEAVANALGTKAPDQRKT